MEFSSFEEYVDFVSQDPPSDEVKKNEDGSLYIPISNTQNKLDEVYCALWDWDFKESFIGKKQATGKGVINVRIKICGELICISKSGSAGIRLSGDMRMDYPLLEAMTFLSAARKLGRWFGRDLNRDRDDAPLPVVDISNEKYDADEEFNYLLSELGKIEYREDAQKHLDSTSFKYSLEAKRIVDRKPYYPKNSNQ